MVDEPLHTLAGARVREPVEVVEDQGDVLLVREVVHQLGQDGLLECGARAQR
jgi:hypothetical protein